MTDSLARKLCFHATILMFIAFFAGFMIGAVAVGQIQGSIDDWRLAHMEPLINGLLLFAIAGCAGKFLLTEARAKIVVFCLVAMAYCNTLFGVMRGLTGAGGFQFDDSLANNITALAGMLGVPLGFVAFALILVGVAAKPGAGTVTQD